MKDTTQASCADSGTSNVKFHVVEYRSGLWWPVCGTGNDGSTMMSNDTVPAHTISKQGRCRKSLCQRRFFGADEEAAKTNPEPTNDSRVNLPGPAVEREKFEAWKDEMGPRCPSGTFSPSPLEAWQARALLASAPIPAGQEVRMLTRTEVEDGLSRFTWTKDQRVISEIGTWDPEPYVTDFGAKIADAIQRKYEAINAGKTIPKLAPATTKEK